jgi:hypothetical protein
MNILVEEDLTGQAPASHRYAAIDTDWFEDNPIRSHVGYGETTEEAIAALMEIMREFEL